MKRKRMFLLWTITLGLAIVSSAGAQDAKTYFEQGNAHFRSGSYLEAIKSYDKALEMDPRDSRFFLLRGVSFAALGKY